MTEPVAVGKIQETQISRYRSTRGLDYESVPWRLWEKSKKLFWDPADIDFSQDAVDWQTMSEEERTLVAEYVAEFLRADQPGQQGHREPPQHQSPCLQPGKSRLRCHARLCRANPAVSRTTGARAAVVARRAPMSNGSARF